MIYKGKPYCLMDDLGGKTPIFGNTHIYILLVYTPKNAAALIRMLDWNMILLMTKSRMPRASAGMVPVDFIVDKSTWDFNLPTSLASPGKLNSFQAPKGNSNRDFSNDFLRCKLVELGGL